MIKALIVGGMSLIAALFLSFSIYTASYNIGEKIDDLALSVDGVFDVPTCNLK